MAFLTSSVTVKVYTDANQTEFPQELVPSIQKEYSNEDVTEIQATTLVLAASGSQSISFNGVGTVKRWYLFSDAADLSLVINGATAMTYQMGEPGLVPITLSSMAITNSSSSVATTVTLVMIAS